MYHVQGLDQKYSGQQTMELNTMQENILLEEISVNGEIKSEPYEQLGETILPGTQVGSNNKRRRKKT